MSSASFFFAVAACCVAGALGGYAMARPTDALMLVGLKPDEDKPHALSEARATYGGLFLVSHFAAAAALGYAPQLGAGMALALSLAWLGAAIGRGVSMFTDKASGIFNIRALVFEAVMALALALPFLDASHAARMGRAMI